MITQKPKICSVCERECILWQSIPPTCVRCSQRLKQANKPTYKHVPLKQTEGETTAKPFKAISKVSPKQLKRLAEYRKARDEHFKEFPTCQYPGCGITKIQLHHGAGRCGDLLTNKKYFRSLCDDHHKYIELNPLEAKKLKLSFDRLT